MNQYFKINLKDSDKQEFTKDSISDFSRVLLRIESNNEALKTKKIAAKLGFDPKIIKIKDRYTSGNLQNWARIRRRDILYNIAQKHSADIILGHQYDDQIETIYMRLIKSSGFCVFLPKADK